MSNTNPIRMFVLSFLLTAAFTLYAEPPRIALVVGNAAYSGDAVLKNPVNDATDVAASLKKIGWNVTLLTNGDRRAINRAIVTYRDELALVEGSTALFYYAGHGIQVEGFNYLIPVKTEFETIDDVKADAISMQSITSAFEQAKTGVSLIILDACRDNPFAKKMTRSLGGSRGLTVVQNGGGSKGSAIMFSTSPGDVALDGTGRNGIFTAALLKYIDTDLKIEDLFKKVTGEVRDISGGSQKPWINASLSSDFYFVPDTVRAARAAEILKAAELARQAEIDKAAADAAAAASLTAKADMNKPKGRVRIESHIPGKVYFGSELLGEIESDTPLMVDGLVTGKQAFRFVSPGLPDEIKTATITEKAYITVVFGKPPETPPVSAIAVAPQVIQTGAANQSILTLKGSVRGSVAIVDGPAGDLSKQSFSAIAPGETRRIENLAPGTYQIETSFEIGSEPVLFSKRVILAPGTENIFTVQPDNAVVYLKDDNDMTGSRVYLNNELVGNMPLSIQLPASQVSLTIVKPWCEPIFETVDGSVPALMERSFSPTAYISEYREFQELSLLRENLTRERDSIVNTRLKLKTPKVGTVILALAGFGLGGAGYVMMNQAKAAYDKAATSADAIKYRGEYIRSANMVQIGLLAGGGALSLNVVLQIFTPGLRKINVRQIENYGKIMELENAEQNRNIQ